MTNLSLCLARPIGLSDDINLSHPRRMILLFDSVKYVAKDNMLLTENWANSGFHGHGSSSSSSSSMPGSLAS